MSDSDPRIRAALEEAAIPTPESSAGWEDVLGRLERRHRRRTRLVALAAAGIGVVVLVLGLLAPWSEGPGALARAAAAIATDDGEIVHTRMSGRLPDGRTATSEIWWRDARNARSLSTLPTGGLQESAIADGRLLTYDPETDTIRVQGGLFTSCLGPEQETFDPRTGEISCPDPLAAIRRALASGKAEITGQEQIRGRAALRIGFSAPGLESTSYLVDAATLEPLRIETPDLATTATDIDLVEFLPATEENLALLDLRAQHPGAVVEKAGRGP